MARTKAEIRAFLDSQVGKRVNAKCGSLSGQCVSLIKALFEFLGVANPYAARGNAKDAGNNYVKQGIARAGDGWLRICVNPHMGGGYGHIWIDLKDETNYEQNGARALTTTKGTRPISNAKQIINLDNWIQPDYVAPAGSTDGRVAQNGTFTASVNRNIRREHPAGAIVGVFNAGASQCYDSYRDYGNFRYVSWIGASGKRNYVAVRRLSDNKRYGVCK